MNLFKKHVPATEDASAADGQKEIPENSAGEIVQEPGESYISFLNRRAAAGRDPDRLLSISAPPGRENDREFIEDRLANDISEKIKAIAHDSDMNPVNMQTLPRHRRDTGPGNLYPCRRFKERQIAPCLPARVSCEHGHSHVGT